MLNKYTIIATAFGFAVALAGCDGKRHLSDQEMASVSQAIGILGARAGFAAACGASGNADHEVAFAYMKKIDKEQAAKLSDLFTHGYALAAGSFIKDKSGCFSGQLRASFDKAEKNARLILDASLE